jgi:ATP-binding cassette subfamily F protein uup
VGYLGDFLFTPEQVRARTGTLSGGERNRLLLARLLSQPANVLVLDEPTNDLDVETLELLEEVLSEFPGTVLVVSHDRSFLNNVVTSTLAFEGKGRVCEFAGGYDDYLLQSKGRETGDKVAGDTKPKKTKETPTSSEGRGGKAKPKKLTWKESRELETLFASIETLEADIEARHGALADPNFYKDNTAEAMAEQTQKCKQVEDKLAETYRRWEELESRAG